MSNERTYKGRLLLRRGAVRGDAARPRRWATAIASSCRQWSAGPVNAFTLWKPTALRVTRGAANIGTYNKTPKSFRKWCTKCGGHLFTDHPTWGVWWTSTPRCCRS